MYYMDFDLEVRAWAHSLYTGDVGRHRLSATVGLWRHIYSRDNGSGYVVRGITEFPKSSVVDLGCQDHSGTLSSKFQINNIWVEFYIKNKLKSGAHMGTPLLVRQ